MARTVVDTKRRKTATRYMVGGISEAIRVSGCDQIQSRAPFVSLIYSRNVSEIWTVTSTRSIVYECKNGRLDFVEKVIWCE